MYPLKKLLIKQPKTQTPSSLLDKNILLVGFMGSGKSSTGKALARLLTLSFIDIDDVIIRSSEKKSINEIFETEGETSFRKIERNALLKTIAQSNQVIATGGGTLIYNPPSLLRSSQLMKKEDVVVLLDAAFETCVERCKYSDRRPLFRDLEKAKTLYTSRKPQYEEMADIKVNIDNKTSHEVALIIKSLIHQ